VGRKIEYSTISGDFNRESDDELVDGMGYAIFGRAFGSRKISIKPQNPFTMTSCALGHIQARPNEPLKFDVA